MAKQKQREDDTIPSTRGMNNHDARKKLEAHRKATADVIIGYHRSAELLMHEINQIAKRHIPDFHFLNDEVSTFWRCIKSPIGMCVFRLWQNPKSLRIHKTFCRYCKQPSERK